MKKFLFAVAALIMAPTSAIAQSSISTQNSICSSVGALAGKIMKARQIGIPKVRVLSVVQTGSAEKITRSLIELAYLTPVYPNEYMQNTAIENFQMQSEYMCYQSSTD